MNSMLYSKEILQNEYFHHPEKGCKLEKRIATTKENKKIKIYYCKTHKEECLRSYWKIGWYKGTNSLELTEIVEYEKLDGKACFNLANACVTDCICKPKIIGISRNNTDDLMETILLKKKDIMETRSYFALSDMVKAWCDITEIDYKKLRNTILKYNFYEKRHLPTNLL